MVLSKITTVLKRNRSLYRSGVWVKSRLPKRFYYSSAYSYILSLNKRYERPDQKEDVRALLRRQLAAYLREALESVPYYRETVKVRTADIDESNVVDALKEFPYLQKSTVVDHKEAFMNRGFDKNSLTYSTSGGSTGRGIGVWRSKKEIDIENAFVLSEWGKLGLDWEKSRIVRIGADANKRDDEDPFKYWANRLFISTFHLHARWMDEIYRAIIAFKPDFIWAYPSGAEMLAGYLEEHAKPPIKLKGILLSSETLLAHQYALFKRIFAAPVSDLYGLSERTNMAFLHESKNGGHFYYRLVDTYGYSENYRDEYGNDEIVGTSYWNSAMPLIRYRTSDIGTIDENGIIRKLQGRTQDFLIDRKGRRLPALSIRVEEYAWDYISISQLVQNKVGELIIRVVPKKSFTDSIKELILSDMRNNFGEFIDAQIEVVDEIAWTKAGKRRIIINNLGQR
jgi:phenylacetate-CoA ligase